MTTLPKITRRRTLMGAALGVLLAAGLTGAPAPAAAGEPALRAQALQAMRTATEFMVEKVAHQGGYVWAYTADMSRRWGELEAYPTMVWVQPPGTATMGHLYLDAYNATGDSYYYAAAEQVAGALIAGQHSSGGWDYLIDFAGQESARRWYETIGANAWRMEEFHKFQDNATFDDEGTSESAQFLLRMYLAKRDPKYREPLERAVRFVLDSQYPVGGWPQRWPQPEDPAKQDYSAYITFNDDVAALNIEFLVMVRQTLTGDPLGDDPRLMDSIRRAMDSYLVTQQPQPQPAWGLQHTLDLKPAGARTYEPKAMVTHTTASNVKQLMDFYELTGDLRYLARIGEALDWLDRVRLPADKVKNGRTHPTFIEIGTDRPLYVHRRGSNVVNGEYFVTDRLEGAIGHYSPTRAVDVPALRQRYERLKATPPAEASRHSPLKANGIVDLPRFFTLGEIEVSDLNLVGGKPLGAQVSDDDVRALIDGLNVDGYWPTPLRMISHPYSGPGPAEPVPGDFASTRVGDHSDTSPFITDRPEMGISTGTFIQNMSNLIAYVAGATAR